MAAPKKKQPKRGKGTAAKKKKVDKPRASKEGNRYHEAWLARRSLELIFPRDGLIAIAVEGLHDETGLSQEAIEIADATFYYGGTKFASAKRIQIEQFKYSISKETAPFRATDAAKTLKKFAKADADFTGKNGAKPTAEKLRYGITTNRPIAKPLAEALRCAAQNITPREAATKTQLSQIKAALGLNGSALESFCRRLTLSGFGTTVAGVDGDTQRTIADWSASGDILAKARMGALRKLISDKAAIPGQDDKTIFKEDVLATFGIGNEKDLLPTTDAFPDVGEVVERAQTDDLIGKLKGQSLVLVYAPGGIGKTVFVQSLAEKLKTTGDEVVLFDCFGGGAYRIPTDGRHKPERGLMHIVNELAARGLCDPLLPGATDPIEVVRTAEKRFEQAVTVLRRSRPAARLQIILDAMDNSGVQADDLGEASFPRLLFKTFALGGLPAGVAVIGTCRPERTTEAIGDATSFKYSLTGFSLAETTKFVKARRPEATTEQIASLQYRSGGNPRILANLIKASRALTTGKTEVAKLDELISEQIAEAVNYAKVRGAKEDAVSGFLCALSRLPPPVPIDEIASAFGQTKEAIESFAADLNPLLDRTRHGLIFRDEPTETLVRKQYGDKISLLGDVVARLKSAQDSSAYATRSLPGLLFAIGDVSSLQELAFDLRFPPSLSSDAAKRTIRINRLRVAVAAAARAGDADAMTALLSELSSVAIVNERGDDYFISNPDLVMALGDSEAVRRLYESTKGWFGARPSRLAIAALLEGEIGEAHNEAVRSIDWLRWMYSTRENQFQNDKTSTNDYAAWPLYRLETGKFKQVADFLNHWMPEHGFTVAKRVLELDGLARSLGKAKLKDNVDRDFAFSAHCPAVYLAAFLEQRPSAPTDVKKHVIRALAKKFNPAMPIERSYPDRGHGFQDGLLRAAVTAKSLGLPVEAAAILKAISGKRYNWYQLRERIAQDNLSSRLLAIALKAALASKSPTLFDCLPQEIAALVEGVPCAATLKDQERAVLDAIDKAAATEIEAPESGEKKFKVSGSDRYEWSNRFRSKVYPAYAASVAAYDLMVAKGPAARKSAIKGYFDAWEGARAANKKDNYGSDREVAPIDQYFLNGYLSLMQSLGLRDDDGVTPLLHRLKDCKYKPSYIITDIISRLAQNIKTQQYVGALAKEVISLIGTMDNTDDRASQYADLAKAILPADGAEARQLFVRGYGELTAIGSGDYELVNELLLFACRLGRAPLSAKSAHMLGKVVELSTPYEAEKFPWSLAASAFAACWGLDYLAQIARWDDRDKIALDWTVGSAVTAQVKTGAITARTAFVIISLVDPVETHGWEIQRLLEAALDGATTTQDKEMVVSEYLDLLERKYIRSVPERELKTFEETVQQRDHALLAIATSRVADMRLRQAEPYLRDGEYSSPISPDFEKSHARQQEQDRKKARKLAAGTTVSSASLESLVDRLNKVHGRLDVKTEAFDEICGGLPMSQRANFVQALVETKNLELYPKLAILRSCKAMWLPQSPSGLAYLKGIGLRLAELHVKEMLSRDWGFMSQLDELAELSGDSKADIAVRIADLAATQELKVDATAWLSLAQIISETAKPEVPRDALDRILSGDAARIAKDVGDGDWRGELAAPNNEHAVAAGLIWSQLGSQNVYIRWAAAHSVRRAARLGLWPIIDELFKLFAANDAGPFQDRKLPFFQRHAQLWFLIAVARVAMDFPDNIAAYEPALVSVLTEASQPHPVMRDAAKRALVAALAGAMSAKTKAVIAKVNVSPFPTIKMQPGGFAQQRPKGKTAAGFSLEYDFNKYEVAAICSLFGLPEWQVHDQIAVLVHGWAPAVTSMYQFHGKKEGESDSYASRTSSDFHSYGYYLAWHAIDIVAGRNLKAKPIYESTYDHERWAYWLAGRQLTRQDGLWISDGKDPYPRVAGISLRVGSDQDAHPTYDIAKILKLIGLSGDKVEGGLVIDGDWKSEDDVRVDIDSVLVAPAFSNDAAVAAVTAPMHQAWLPKLHRYEAGEEDNRGNDMPPLEPLMAITEVYYRFDRKDPLFNDDILTRVRVTKDIVKDFGLVPEPEWERNWSDATGNVVLTSSAWGGRNGLGQGDDYESGQNLVCTPAYLKKVLTARDRDLLVLIHLSHTKDYERHRNLKNQDRYTRTLVAVVIDKNLNARIISPTEAQVKAVAAIGTHNIDFDKRYAAITKKQAPVSKAKPSPAHAKKTALKSKKEGPSKKAK
ncbi:MAG TPA: hypothetical protein VGM68_10925 [Rhizomicrobium sp.]|jgi:hypothetical protein